MGVRHPNLLAVLDMGTTNECIYIVTEFIESQSLRDVIQQEGRIAPKRAVDLFRSLVSAMAALHEAGIVSGGLSPETIRVAGSHENDSERLAISPFGLSSRRQLELILRGSSGGNNDASLEYSAPEQRRGAGSRSSFRCLHARCDLHRARRWRSGRDDSDRASTHGRGGRRRAAGPAGRVATGPPSNALSGFGGSIRERERSARRVTEGVMVLGRWPATGGARRPAALGPRPRPCAARTSRG